MSVVDTNVLIHSAASGSPDHSRARTALTRLTSQGPVAVTRQVLREYLAGTARPQSSSRPLTLTEATTDAAAFIRRFVVLEDGPAVWDELMALTGRFVLGGKQIRDANIVATMPSLPISWDR